MPGSRAYAARLAKRFQQDAIHVRAVSIEMLDENASDTSPGSGLPEERGCAYAQQRPLPHFYSSQWT